MRRIKTDCQQDYRDKKNKIYDILIFNIFWFHENVCVSMNFIIACQSLLTA